MVNPTKRADHKLSQRNRIEDLLFNQMQDCTQPGITFDSIAPFKMDNVSIFNLFIIY